jgi:hypothetical protein
MADDPNNERIDRARESLQRMERMIERHTPKPKKRPQATRGKEWGAAGSGGLVVRGGAKNR